MRVSCCLHSQTVRGIAMHDLIEEYRQQISLLEQRLAQLQALTRKRHGECYADLLHRIGMIEMEIGDLHAAVAAMKEY